MPSGESGKSGSTSGFVLSSWNLLLLLPFIVLFTPIYNRVEPTFIGLPFFYWFQFAVILLGVACTVVVHRMTRSRSSVPAAGAEPDVDRLDEGSAG